MWYLLIFPSTVHCATPFRNSLNFSNWFHPDTFTDSGKLRLSVIYTSIDGGGGWFPCTYGAIDNFPLTRRLTSLWRILCGSVRVWDSRLSLRWIIQPVSNSAVFQLPHCLRIQWFTTPNILPSSRTLFRLQNIQLVSKSAISLTITQPKNSNWGKLIILTPSLASH